MPLAVDITIGQYFCDVQKFTNIIEQPKKYTSNNQTSMKIKLYKDVHICHWQLVKCMKDVYIHPWFLA